MLSTREDLQTLISESLAKDGELDLAYDNTLLTLHAEMLQDLAGIRKLRLGCPSNNDLQIAASMPDLECLVLMHAFVTDQGLSHLANCKKLRELYLSDAPITDGGLEYLAAIPSLEKLDLPARTIRGSGLHHLARLPNLRILHFWGHHRDRPGRSRVEPPLTAKEDQFLELAEAILSRLDTNPICTVAEVVTVRQAIAVNARVPPRNPKTLSVDVFLTQLQFTIGISNRHVSAFLQPRNIQAWPVRRIIQIIWIPGIPFGLRHRKIGRRSAINFDFVREATVLIGGAAKECADILQSLHATERHVRDVAPGPTDALLIAVGERKRKGHMDLALLIDFKFKSEQKWSLAGFVRRDRSRRITKAILS